MPGLSRRTTDFTDSVIRRMTRTSNQFGAAAPLQEAAVTGLRFDPGYYAELLSTYTGRRERFLRGLDALQIPHTVPQGAYYVLLDISEFGFESDLDFRI